MKISYVALALIMAVGVYSCSDDNDIVDNSGDNTTSSGVAIFVPVTGESTQYIMSPASLDSGTYSIGTNIAELETSIQNWIFGGTSKNIALGLVYAQTSAGTGLAYGADDSNNVTSLGTFQLAGTFKTYGFYGDYGVTAAGAQSYTDANGDTKSDAISFSFVNIEDNLTVTTDTITTENLTGNGEAYVAPSGIVGDGNGNMLIGLVPYDSEGNAIATDSCWVGEFDSNLSLVNIFRSGKISYATGRYRSRYYPMIRKTDDGDIYVFSGSYEGDLDCGALKINSGETGFDSDYYFDIQSLSNGYKFRRALYITGSYFLLNFYNDTEVSAVGAATRYAIVDMANKTLTWLSGDFPSYDEIDAAGDPGYNDGKLYFPVTVSGEYPVIYIVDPATGVATKGATISGATSADAVGFLTTEN